MNGKTIGRTKPGPDFSVLEETQRGEVAFQELQQSGDEERMSSRERGFHRENVQLKRSLDVERARVAVLIASGGKPTLKPIGTAMEREAEFERRILAMGDMTEEARLREVKALFEDVKHYRKAKAEWLAEVDAAVEKKLESGKPVEANEAWTKVPEKKLIIP